MKPLAWEKWKQERIKTLLRAQKGASLECRKCGLRKAATGFAQYLKRGAVKWCGVCKDCGGKAPEDAAKAFSEKRAGVALQSLKEAPKRRGRSPRFREGYGPDSVGIELDLYVHQIQQAFFMKGCAVTLRTIRMGGKPLSEKACWAALKQALQNAEFLKGQLLEKAVRRKENTDDNT